MSGSLAHGSNAEPNLTPMLDMVFQLVTFFMLVINFKAAAMDLTLRLPVVGSAAPVSAPGEDLMILNVDMAFQLLTFFILTFKPAPVEGEIALRMPQAVPQGQKPGAAIGRSPSDDPLKDLDSLTISVLADPQGGIGGLAIGEQRLGIDRLAGRLQGLLTDPNSALRQVVIQAGPSLRYDSLMTVVDKCARQTLPDGQPLKRLCFVEMPGDAE